MIERELEGIVAYSLRKVIQHGEAALDLPIEANNEIQARLIYVTKLKLLNLEAFIDLNCLSDMGFSAQETELLLAELEDFLTKLTPSEYLH